MRVLAISEDSKFVTGGRLVFFSMVKALEDAGHEIELITTSFGKTQKVVSLPRRVRRVFTPPIRIVGYLVFAFIALFVGLRKARNSDVVFVNVGLAVPIAILVGWGTRRKVVELHQDVFELREIIDMAPTFSRRITAVVRYLLFRYPLLFVDRVLSVSPWTARRLREVWKVTKPIDIVGNPIEV